MPCTKLFSFKPFTDLSDGWDILHRFRKWVRYIQDMLPGLDLHCIYINFSLLLNFWKKIIYQQMRVRKLHVTKFLSHLLLLKVWKKKSYIVSALVRSKHIEHPRWIPLNLSDKTIVIKISFWFSPFQICQKKKIGVDLQILRQRYWNLVQRNTKDGTLRHEKINTH